MLLSFDEAACADVEVAGGKGASLARMTGLGHAGAARLRRPRRRPRGGARRHGRRAPRGARARGGRRGPRGGSEEAIALVRAADFRGRFPGEVETAYARLGDVPGRGAVERDGGGLRGGELRRPAGDLPARARRRRDRGADPRLLVLLLHGARALLPVEEGSLDDLGMAVVVQRMVEPDVAGVLFTIDPTRGARPHAGRGRLRARRGRGLGSAHARPLRARARRPGEADKLSPRRTRSSPGRRRDARGRAAPRGGRGAPLTEEQLAQLAAVGLELEERLGGPQDIEWAIQDDELFVLQSAPRHGVARDLTVPDYSTERGRERRSPSGSKRRLSSRAVGRGCRGDSRGSQAIEVAVGEVRVGAAGPGGW